MHPGQGGAGSVLAARHLGRPTAFNWRLRPEEEAVIARGAARSAARVLLVALES